MKQRQKSVFSVILLLVAFCFVGLLFTSNASAEYDKKACLKWASKSSKLLKEFKGLKIKDMIKTIDKEVKDGITEDEIKQIDTILGPFDNGLAELKKISNAIKKMKENCLKEESKKEKK